MKRINRRSFLRCTGVAAATVALRSQGVAWAEGAPLAATTAGKVRGAIEDGVNVFKGIPYGADTAKTRFKAPLTPAPWKDVKECTRFAPMAPQLPQPAAVGSTHAARGEGGQSEDCLHLNVWTGGLRDNRKRPVLVYFHGGAYNNGTVNSDLYDGKRLVHCGDVVVVTVNHRLNGFGYLYLGDLAPEYAESGNAGQLAATRGAC